MWYKYIINSLELLIYWAQIKLFQLGILPIKWLGGGVCCILKFQKHHVVPIGSFAYFNWRSHKSLSHPEQIHVGVGEGCIREIPGCRGLLLSSYCFGSCLQLCIQTSASSFHQVSSILVAEVCPQSKCSGWACASLQSFLFDMNHSAARALVQRLYSGSFIKQGCLNLQSQCPSF